MKYKLTQWFVYEWGKPTWQKSHRVILRSLLSRIHYYHNKRLQVKESQYLIPTYNWTITPILNWTCFVVTISPFNARLPVRGLLTNLRKMLVAKFFSSSTMKTMKLFGYKTLQCTNTVASWRERWIENNMHVKIFCIKVHHLWRPWKQSLYIFRIVRKESINIYTRIGWKSELKIWFS